VVVDPQDDADVALAQPVAEHRLDAVDVDPLAVEE
jgi:hypothetical protein